MLQIPQRILSLESDPSWALCRFLRKTWLPDLKPLLVLYFEHLSQDPLMWISFGLGACSGWLIFQFLIVFFSPKDAFFCFFQWEILWLYWLFRQFRFLSPAPGLFDPQKTFTLNFQVPCGLLNFAGLLNFFFFFSILTFWQSFLSWSLIAGW